MSPMAPPPLTTLIQDLPGWPGPDELVRLPTVQERWIYSGPAVRNLDLRHHAQTRFGENSAVPIPTIKASGQSGTLAGRSSRSNQNPTPTVNPVNHVPQP